MEKTIGEKEFLESDKLAILSEIRKLREEVARLTGKVNALEHHPSNAPMMKRTSIPQPPIFESKVGVKEIKVEQSKKNFLSKKESKLHSQQVRAEQDDLDIDLPPPPSISPAEEFKIMESYAPKIVAASVSEPKKDEFLEEATPVEVKGNLTPKEPLIKSEPISTIPVFSESQVGPYRVGQVIEVKVTVVGKDGSGIARENGITILVNEAKKGKMKVKVDKIFGSMVYCEPTFEPLTTQMHQTSRDQKLPELSKGTLPVAYEDMQIPLMEADDEFEHSMILK